MDASTRLSQSYTVGDFIKTSTGLPNMPSDDYLPNMKALANVLELLQEIDDFRIESGFRSQAVNNAVGGADYSYHSDGLAADIYPASMTNQQFWNYIHNNPRYRNAVGEYIFYPLSHGTIHVSAPTPTKIGYGLIQNANGTYTRAEPPSTPDPAYEMDFSLPEGAPLYIGLALGLGLILMAVYRTRSVA